LGARSDRTICASAASSTRDVCRRPKAPPSEDWEDREQTLFRSTQFGDDVDRPLIKSDGGYTYFASDIAYHKTKIDRGFLSLVDVWGADHGGYVKRMQAAGVGAFRRQGELRGPALSARSADAVRASRSKCRNVPAIFVTLREVVDESRRRRCAFYHAECAKTTRRSISIWPRSSSRDRDNPVFYVQYAHARARSVLRQGQAAFPDLDLRPVALAGADLATLDDDGERGLLRTLSPLSSGRSSGSRGARSRIAIAFHAHELATQFHSHYNKGKESPHLRFVNEKVRNFTEARMALVTAVALVLASALSILA